MKGYRTSSWFRMKGIAGKRRSRAGDAGPKVSRTRGARKKR